MRRMRLFASLLLAALLAALSGCGNGGGGSATLRSVTVTLRWPSAGKSATRVLPAAALTGYVTIEVYDGKTRLAVRSLALAQASLTLSLPAKTLTFYANGYAQGTDQTVTNSYATDPNTGQPAHPGGGAYTPLASGDPHPVVHAVAVVDVPTQNNIVFTLENTIAALVPLAGKTTFSLDQPGSAKINGFDTITLRDTVQALTADGATVLTGTSTLVFSNPDNALENARLQVDQTDPNNPRLLLKATGVAHVTVTDSEVNSDAANHQPALTATIAYTLTPRLNKQTLTLDTNAASLKNTLPYYARSVTYTLTQDPLVDPNANTALRDNPPPPVVSSPFAVSVTRTVQSGVTAVSLPAIATDYIPTGRTLTLQVSAWSRPDGTGALLAQYTQSGLTPLSETRAVALTSNVAGFALAPDSPAVNLTNTSPAPAGQNTLQLQAFAILKTDATRIPIDPGTVRITTSVPQVTVTFPTTPTDSSGNPYLLLAFNYAAIPAADTVTVTAFDKQAPALTGATTVRVTGVTPVFILQ